MHSRVHDRKRQCVGGARTGHGACVCGDERIRQGASVFGKVEPVCWLRIDVQATRRVLAKQLNRGKERRDCVHVTGRARDGEGGGGPHNSMALGRANLRPTATLPSSGATRRQSPRNIV